MTKDKHIGSNVRCIRLLRGIKQEKFAVFMNLTQQKVSKLENRRNLPLDILQQAATVLDVSVEVIRNFDVSTLLNMVTGEQAEQAVLSAQEIIAYFKEEVRQRDQRIKELEQVLYGIRYGK